MTDIGGRYEILGELGRGGMATVHLARQTDLDRLVAVKELSALASADTAAAARFLREARLAGSLSHSNVVTIHDLFEHDGTPFIAMEHVPGGPLRGYQDSLSSAQVLGVLLDVLAGLAHAERLGIVHRDLKPENLLVTADGHVKIADFGIARAVDRARHATRLTATGTTIGTPDYIAPEQALGETTGPWSDLYSLGCIAFELLTGRPPFADADSSMAVLLAHVNEGVPSLRAIAPGVDPRLAEWVARMVAREPADRFRSAAVAAAELEDIAVETLGPRWRASAAIVPELVTPARVTRARTTAPFEPALAATLPPTRLPTGPTAPLPPDRRPRRGARKLLWGLALVTALAALAAQAVAPGGPGSSGAPSGGAEGRALSDTPAAAPARPAASAVPRGDAATRPQARRDASNTDARPGAKGEPATERPEAAPTTGDQAIQDSAAVTTTGDPAAQDAAAVTTTGDVPVAAPLAPAATAIPSPADGLSCAGDSVSDDPSDDECERGEP